MTKRILAIILATVVLAAGIAYFIWESGSYVAKVGNQKIRNHEYIFFLRAQKETTETVAGATDEQALRDLWETPVDGEDPKTIVMNQALENAKEFKIQLIKAKQDKFKLPENDRKEILQYLKSSLQNTDNVNYVKNDLSLTLAQFREIMLNSELVNRYAYDYMQKNRDAVTVNDDEIKEFYDANKENFDEVTITHILIPATDENETVEEKQEKEQLAQEMYDRISKGEDIQERIETYTEDALLKTNGGTYTFTYVQPIPLDDAQEIKDWAFSGNIGDSGMIETDSGWHIMRLEDKKAFEGKREMVKSALKAQKLADYYYAQLQEWSKDPAFNLVKNEDVLNKITQKTFQSGD